MYLKQEIVNNSNSVNSMKSVNGYPIGSSSDNSFQNQFVNTQLLNLKKLSPLELKEKYKELFEVRNINIKDIKFKSTYLIKILSYKIQTLYGMSNTGEEEIEELIKFTKQKLSQTERILVDDSRKKTISSETNKNQNTNKSTNTNKTINTKDNIKSVIAIGSTITTYRGNQKYIVKVLPNNKFSYNDKIYKSLTAIATDITGTKWNGYTFFKLKRVSGDNTLSLSDGNNIKNKQMVAV